MKTVIKNTAAAIALAAIFAGPASAIVSKSELNKGVDAAVNAGSTIYVTERNRVVTLSGYYSDYRDQVAAIKAAEDVEGVVRVIDLANRTR